MSELIERHNATTRNHLLNTVSALALVVYVSATAPATAQSDERPTVWIELGGQTETVQGVSSPFTAPFMTAISPTPGPYANDIFLHNQRPARMALGFDGSVLFQPQGSDWVFSVGVRYGRSQTNRHVHQQSPAITTQQTFSGGTHFTGHRYVAAFADTKSKHDESHAILDFSVGKDVGLGAFGRDGLSTLSVGIRFAQFSEKSDVDASGRPSILHISHPRSRALYSFYNYTMFAQASRSFHGVGPSLSWNASATLLGNRDAGELTFDWGINGALLFGRQKTKASHTTQAYHLPITENYGGMYDGYYYTRVYRTSHQHTRSRGVTIPNLGGFAGLSVKYPNVKFSLGYRADFFFGAVDAGIDERHTKDLGFNGPFASVSIGLGG